MGERPVTHFALMRHAETTWTQEKRVHGRKDAPLTARGHEQAARWGETLKRYRWDHLVASDLGRARRTAALMNRVLGTPCSIEARLREQDWGLWSGMRLKEIDAAELHAQEQRGWGFRPMGGESRLEVLERVRQALVELAGRWPGRRILVVTHEGVLRCLLYRLSRRAFMPDERPLLEPRRLHWVCCAADGLRLDRLNELI
jgi:broad specificity phosphatase PhoE